MLRLRLALASRWRRQASRPVLSVARLRFRAARSPSLPAGAIATLAFVEYSDTLLDLFGKLVEAAPGVVVIVELRQARLDASLLIDLPTP